MRSKKPSSSNQLMLRTEIADCIFAMVFGSGIFDDGVEIYSEYDFPPGVSGDELIAPLVSRGCDLKCLLMILDKAVDIQCKTLSLTPARTLSKLADRMRRIAEEIRKVEVPGFRAVLEELEERRRHPDMKGTKPQTEFRRYGESELAQFLQDQASLYDEWTQLASEHLLPKDLGGMMRLPALCVAWYVKHATGKTHFPEVSQFLESVGLGQHSTTMLSRKLKEFESDYSRCCARLERFVQEAESGI